MYRTIFALALCVFLSGCVIIGNDVSTSSVSGQSQQQLDPNNPMLKQRVIFLNGNVNNSTAQAVSEKLVYLNQQSDSEPIKLVINSPGGDGTAFLTIANMIKSTKAPVDTINVSLCGSAGALLFMSATGQRYAFENSIFVIHPAKGSPDDFKKIFDRLQEYLFKNKAQLPAGWLPLKKEHVLTAKQALEYKIVDKIIEKIDFEK